MLNNQNLFFEHVFDDYVQHFQADISGITDVLGCMKKSTVLFCLFAKRSNLADCAEFLCVRQLSSTHHSAPATVCLASSWRFRAARI
jgi:hypothetical protein